MEFFIRLSKRYDQRSIMLLTNIAIKRRGQRIIAKKYVICKQSPFHRIRPLEWKPVIFCRHPSATSRLQVMAIPVVEFLRERIHNLKGVWLKINCSQMKSMSFVNWCYEEVSKSAKIWHSKSLASYFRVLGKFPCFFSIVSDKPIGTGKKLQEKNMGNF